MCYGVFYCPEYDLFWLVFHVSLRRMYFQPLFNSVQFQFSRSVMSNSLQPHRLQHTRLPCSSPTPRACSNSYPLSRWCHPTISSSVVPFYSCFQCFPASKSFPVSQVFGSKYWSFSFSVSPSNEHSGLISFRIEWLDLLAAQGTLKSFPAPQFEGISSSALRLLYGPTLTSIHDYCKNHSLD